MTAPVLTAMQMGTVRIIIGRNNGLPFVVADEAPFPVLHSREEG